MNPLLELTRLGQSVYLDELSRRMLQDGSLKRLIDEDGLHGVTSNPAIFEAAIARSSDYNETIAELGRSGMDVAAVYEDLVIRDIQDAADLFRPLFDSSGGRLGMVSLEVSPELAQDEEGTVAEARHLWQRLDRPNVFIKVPGTAAGVPAIRRLIAEGINVNVTLLFSVERYKDVAEAYISGLEERHARGEPLNVRSVASFFLSRIDVLLDPQLAEIGSEEALALRGKVAIANARMAYAHWQQLYGTDRFSNLAEAGALPQELLWASTGTKNPDYPDVMYVEPLIGPQTINTMPPATLDAYRDHGQPEDRLAAGIPEAREQLEQLARLGIDIEAAAARLEDEGVEKFVTPFASLMETIGKQLPSSARS